MYRPHACAAGLGDAAGMPDHQNSNKNAIIMGDYIHDEPNLLSLSTAEDVLPDVSFHTEALAARSLRRLYLRRWLIVAAGLIIAGFTVFYALPVLPAMVGFALIAASAALLPREGVFRPIRRAAGIDQRAELSQRFIALLDGLPAPAILLTARGQVWSFNLQAKEFLSGLREGQHISAAIRDPLLLETVGGVQASHQPRQTVLLEERVPIERYMEATLSFIAKPGEAANRGPAILLFLRDLTERERLDRLRSDFIANASHELRTPLTSLVGFIDTLQGSAKNDAAAQQRFLAMMAKQAERMARLIDNLLSLSRVEMRQHLRPQNRVDLQDVLRYVVGSLEPLAAASHIELHFQAGEDPAIVLGDRDELVQVFTNLVHNAIKYGHSGGNVWAALRPITVEGEKSRFAIEIRDDGPGIASEHLPRLTERFYRANGNGGEKAGTGLGLAIVKHAVNRHRGDLRIASEPGRGSSFSVVLDEARPA
jgi:two-component system phosphate regulon sensor histidine kinase PhoR